MSRRSPGSVKKKKKITFDDFLKAADRGNLKIIKEFLAENPEQIDRLDDGFSALDHAAEWGHANIVSYLIDRGADIEENIHAVHLAASNNCLEVIKVLNEAYSKKPSYNLGEILDENFRTPLHSAALGGSLEVIKYLHDNKLCDVSARDNIGKTPLHYVAGLKDVERRSETIDLLISIGAIEGVRDSSGYNYQQLIEYNDSAALRENKRLKVFDSSEKKSASSDSERPEAVKKPEVYSDDSLDLGDPSGIPIFAAHESKEMSRVLNLLDETGAFNAALSPLAAATAPSSTFQPEVVKAAQTIAASTSRR